MELPLRPLAIAAVVIVVLATVYVVYPLALVPGPVNSSVPDRFTANGKTFTFTYLATTEAQREAGLMNTKVTNSTTMLFVFPYSAEWKFYMFDTNTSLDMIWVNATGDSGTVVYLFAGAPPCYGLSIQCPRYTPTSPANYVIEAKAGFAAANGISQGTPIQFS